MRGICFHFVMNGPTQNLGARNKVRNNRIPLRYYAATPCLISLFVNVR